MPTAHGSPHIREKQRNGPSLVCRNLVSTIAYAALLTRVPDLKDYTLSELRDWFVEAGQTAFRGDQVFRWLWGQGETAFSQMTNLSKELREQLGELARVSELIPDTIVESTDGTKKYRFVLEDSRAIEAVFIPEGEASRYTVCISTQAGCAMGCTFCHTGTMKLLRNLRPAEIVNQVVAVAADNEPRITNLVLMGMGEPLHNYDNVVRALRILMEDSGLNFSHRKITLSTVGLVPELERLGREVPVNLAVSLHAANDELRNEIVPLNRKYPLAKLIEACRNFPVPARKRVTFEYVQLPGVNDSEKDADELVALLEDLPCKINLIPFNEVPGAPYRAPTDDEVDRFEKLLVDRGFHVLVRRPRGRDVLAACGQLATQGQK